MDQISIEHIPPTAAEYLALRQIAGLSAMSKEGAEIDCQTVFCRMFTRWRCTRRYGQGYWGWRLFLSGGGYCGSPGCSRQGYGKLIMSEIMKYLREHVPARGLVSLLADVPADRLYSQFGFTYTSPKSEGMWWRQGSR